MPREKLLNELLQRCLGEAPAGTRETTVDGVRLFWTSMPTPPAPLLYEAGLVILLQGRKEGQIADQRFIYDENNYLVLTLPMPFQCAHFASREEPLCGLFITFSRQELADMLAQMDPFGGVRAETGLSALAPAPMTEMMRNTITQLLSLQDEEMASRIIGPMLKLEILFHALRGPCGPALAAYAQQAGDDGKFDSLIETMRRDMAKPVRVEEMADQVSMSVSAFHRGFRRRTGQSPLQYVKRLRLHAARALIVFEGVRVGDAAHRVGYESLSQFSREYKRLFEEAPLETRSFSREQGAL
ncbi:AraC family transcriptional regulator N-terminal domain-containing protein [uncultured Cohaesibacter sp.]|uniref:AraC family transcriptional regulator n=1 Tax=uncultured Cohaesibacter sp. TaxID=1002546 RepID=UPI00292E9230|nr:AraC family transcriptional regulator N-terminal domain-containing protein [uncultured Cohaesibacter sp.]